MSNNEREGRARQPLTKQQRQKLRRKRKIRRNLWTLTVCVLLLGAAVLLIMNGNIGGSPDHPSGAVTPGPTPEGAATIAASTPGADELGDPSGELINAGNATAASTATPEPTPPPTPMPVPTPEPTPVKLKFPYYVEVDRGKQVVTVYTLDEVGEYRHIVRQMICSTDSFNRKPPNGVYKLDGQKLRWLTTVATPRSYAQYATRIASKILFHSLPYKTKKPNDLDVKAYNALGTNDSIGCIRLLCDDAKWIYDNLVPGTPVRFVSNARDEDLLKRLAPPSLIGGQWDPTDPDERNPDYDGSYVKPAVTPWLGVTPAPTPSWKAATYK